VKLFRNFFRHQDEDPKEDQVKLVQATEQLAQLLPDYEKIRKSGVFHKPLDPIKWDVTDQDVVLQFEKNLEDIRQHLSQSDTRYSRRVR
jgi:hypothetical protein